MAKQKIYQPDLVQIHNEAYQFHWQGAAPAILRMLREHGIREGLVVDLGCGGGQWLERLAYQGFHVCGVDQSASMIRSAQELLPTADFIHGSMAKVKLPECDAVTALGEPINYLDSPRSVQRTFQKVFDALTPGGIFILDVREPASRRVETRTQARLTDSWAIFVEVEESGPSLVRDITTFRRSGNAFRRRQEIHHLKLYPKKKMEKWLRDEGFRVRSFRSYGKYKLADRQTAYVCRKP